MIMKKNAIIPFLLAGSLYALPVYSQEEPTEPPEKSDEVKLKEIIDSAFKQAKKEQLPLSPGQIKEFQVDMDNTAEAIFPSPPPKMVNRSQNVSLEPGSEPVRLRLSAGYVSSIIAIDSTGEPWPITTSTVGNAKWFSVMKPETGANNMLTISPLKNHVSSNLAITLEGRDAPLIIELSMRDKASDTKPQEADMIVSMRMNQPGPNSAPPIIGTRIDSAVSSDLMSFLDGVPPSGSENVRLKDAPGGVRMWKLSGKFYLRTPHTARWPAWEQVSSSNNGIHVYVMPMTNNIILSVNGESLSIEVLQ